MSIRVFIAVLMALSITARAADTQPTTQASIIDLKADLSIAQADLALTQDRATRDFDNSPAGKPLVGEVAVKQAALEQARASGTTQDRLDASAAFNRAHRSLDDARAEAIKKSRPMLEAQVKVAAANAALAAAIADEKARAVAKQGAEEEKTRNDPLRIAIKKHEVIQGMTDDQVKQAMAFKNDPAKATWRGTKHQRAGRRPADFDLAHRLHVAISTRIHRDANGCRC